MPTTTQTDLAKIVAGTYVPDSPGKANPVIAWVQKQCREGLLRDSITAFAKNQPEFIDPGLVLVESVGPDMIECVIPCKQFDHESTGTFLTEVRFTVNPSSGDVVRA